MTLDQEGQCEIIPLQAFGHEIRSTSKNKGWVFFTINVKSDPLTGLGSVFVNIQEVSPLSKDLINQLLSVSILRIMRLNFSCALS